MNTLLNRAGIESVLREVFQEQLVGGRALFLERDEVQISVGPLTAVNGQYRYMLLISAGCPTRCDLIADIGIQIQSATEFTSSDIRRTNSYGVIEFDGIVPGQAYHLSLAEDVAGIIRLAGSRTWEQLPLVPADLKTAASPSSAIPHKSVSPDQVGVSIDLLTHVLSVCCRVDDSPWFRDCPFAWIRLSAGDNVVGQGLMALSVDDSGRYFGESRLSSFGKDLHEYHDLDEPVVIPAIEATDIPVDLVDELIERLRLDESPTALIQQAQALRSQVDARS